MSEQYKKIAELEVNKRKEKFQVCIGRLNVKVKCR
jgi:hypothetical protein